MFTIRRPAARRLLQAALVAGAALAFAPSPASAQGTDLAVAIDEARLLRIDAQAAEVIVGNPSIADVAVQSGRLLVMTGKSFGATNLIVLDAGGNEILNRRVTVGANPDRMVSMTKGPSRRTFVCAPTCQPALLPGDDPETFSALLGQSRDKFGLAQSVIDESAGTGQ